MRKKDFASCGEDVKKDIFLLLGLSRWMMRAGRAYRQRRERQDLTEFRARWEIPNLTMCRATYLAYRIAYSNKIISLWNKKAQRLALAWLRPLNFCHKTDIKMADDFDLGLLDDDDYKKSVLKTKMLGIAECFMYRLPSSQKSPYR